MKVIDFKRKGNLVRFYLGDDNCNDYYGDDWDDTPYEDNAGIVYDEFIKDHYDIAFPFDYAVFEPVATSDVYGYSKDKMKEMKVPCIVAYKLKENEYEWQHDFKTVIAMKDSIKVYFNDSVDKLKQMEIKHD